ncbi:MAG: arylamine N-acetyltransferase [Acidobacteriota bacterium]|nr:arylamine N-acetyltransferase [Acidobacteriota bacterium]MDQ5871968.1 arylamine N-acetyltransferase [Acidobacteriota bacterium]
MTFAVEDVLDALELSREEPSHRFLERLFHRFNARVPFESASKILRDADIADPAEKPRFPDVFWGDFLEKSTGGTCYARVAAFDALASNLGFSTRKALGRVEKDLDHAALVVETERGEWIADVGFPLPALVPIGGGEVETEIAALSATETDRGVLVRFLSGVPDGPRRLEIFRTPVPDEEFLARWRSTFRADSKFLKNVSLHRRDASRVMTFARGEVRIDDLHTRTRIPLVADRPARLAELFGIEADVLRRAFSMTGDPDPESSDARITAYLSVEAQPEDAFAALATPDAYRRLLEGVAEVTGEGWRLRLSPPGAPQAGFEEEITPDPERRALDVRRRYADGREVNLAFRVEERDGATYLVREATFSGAREDLLKNDSARGRLAGTLAVDLLAWSRLLG